MTREPGGTTLGERLREMLLADRSVKIGARAEALLIFAARSEHIEDVIEPSLSQGRWVLCDRFTDATYAYQGGGRQLGMEAIATLERWVHPALKPDLTLVFDVDINIAEQRLRKSGAAVDRFESESDEFKRRVRDVYAALARNDPQRIHIIDTDQSPDDTRLEVDNILEAHRAWL